MKYISVIIFYLFLTLPVCANIYVSDSTQKAEMLFRQNVSNQDKIIFTHVPRGLIVSIDEKFFFNENQHQLKGECLPMLNQIADVLNILDNNFVIEGHTKDIDSKNSIYNHNWELSLARANNISKYLMRCKKVSPEKIFIVGFGEFMPFMGNVSENIGMDNRIDFVILDYQASR